jgi:manganese/zinc/iron transport system permease protein
MNQIIWISFLSLFFISLSAATVGCFAYLRKQSLIGDVVAHSTLPGVCLAYMFTHTKNPFFLLLGAFASGTLSIYAIDWILKYSKLKADAALAIVMSIFFSVGILLLTYVQHTGSGAQSGLDTFLFGKAAALTEQDMWTFLLVSFLIIAIIFFFYKDFMLYTFDLNYALAIGKPVKLYKIVLTSITVLAIVLGISTVGVILMASLLFTPVATARFWSNKLSSIIPIAALLAVLSSFIGTFLSYSDEHTPTGPSIVLVLAIVALISFVMAPKKGILSKSLNHIRNAQKIQEENILKTMYQLGEQSDDFSKKYSEELIAQKRNFEPKILKKGLDRLISKGYVEKINHEYVFTIQGRNLGQRVTRLHRLWEMYLSQNLMLSPDHVHDDAEAIEHIITPEIEQKLIQELGFPQFDPHQSMIPYKE